VTEVVSRSLPEAADCREMILLTQAELDGELNAAEAIAAAAHRAECARCRAAFQMIRAARTAVRTHVTEQAMPVAVRQRLLSRIRQADGQGASVVRRPAPAVRRAPRWRTWITPGISAAAAAALVLALSPPSERDLGDAILDAHVRALQPGHLLDLPSTNQHNIMPWFDGKIDFAPPVKNLAEQGFPLEGGRLDYVGGRPVAALVYHIAQHPLDLFVWAEPDVADSQPVGETRNGYNVLHWNQHGMAIWVISDVSAPRLHEFAEAWQRAR
jgi:anti-sigma factor RsiW